MRRGTLLGLTGVLMAMALLLPSGASAATPGKIAFVSTRDGNEEIYVMNADGSGQTRLSTTAANVSDRDPAWSPDGKQIAFFSNRDNPASDARELWIMNADGSAPRQLTFNTAIDFSVDWSPEGRQLVFGSREIGGVDNLQIINVDGSGQRQLTFASGNGAYGPHFSPDGQWIAYTNDGTTPNDPLALIRPDGSQFHEINAANSYAPDFTADGKRIVFVGNDGDNEIYSIKPDGTDLKQITVNPANDSSPSPSRDGLNRIAFSSNRGGDQELYVMNADGSGVTPLTNSMPGTNRGPDWQPTATCHGKVATIVGTSASETLTGGPGADVISGQGGKDQISGLDGKDVICGDAGNDKLVGGKGKDKLIGGKGKDKLIGGKGKDTCVGGKGKHDTGKSCEKEKKVP